MCWRGRKWRTAYSVYMAGKKGCNYPNLNLARTLRSKPQLFWKMPWEFWWPHVVIALILYLKNTTSNDSFLEYHAKTLILHESERKVHPSTAARCLWKYLFCFLVSLYNLIALGTHTSPFSALVYKENGTLLMLDVFIRNSDHNPAIFKAATLLLRLSCDLTSVV